VSTIDEKRVYGGRSGARTAYVASAIGLAAVAISGDAVGEFGLIHRGNVRDVAVDASTLVVATDEDVHVVAGGTVHGDGGPDGVGDRSATDFGAATAVGVDGDGRPLAASRDGRLVQYADGWEVLGTVPAAVRAFGRDTVACADGVRSLATLDPPALDDVRDVDDPGPVVASVDGVYRRNRAADADGTDADESDWRRERNGATDRVAATGDRLAAVDDGTLLLKDETNWKRPVGTETVRDVAGRERFYAVTDDGQVLVESGDEWRSRSIGLSEPTRLVVA
jgi:hypothetical protein